MRLNLSRLRSQSEDQCAPPTFDPQPRCSLILIIGPPPGIELTVITTFIALHTEWVPMFASCTKSFRRTDISPVEWAQVSHSFHNLIIPHPPRKVSSIPFMIIE
uniref:Uncharacterized protein n=1 Tax=Compsopogon caeruleus TaxID=31354 RepID=A0A7S1XHE5_9RHOD